MGAPETFSCLYPPALNRLSSSIAVIRLSLLCPLACEGLVAEPMRFCWGARWYGSLLAVLNDGQYVYIRPRPPGQSILLNRLERLLEKNPKLSL